MAIYGRHPDRLFYGTDLGYAAAMYRATFRILEAADEHFYAQHLFDYHWPLHGFGLKDATLNKVYVDDDLVDGASSSWPRQWQRPHE